MELKQEKIRCRSFFFNY